MTLLITIDIELVIMYNHSVQIYINDLFALGLRRLNIAQLSMGEV